MGSCCSTCCTTPVSHTVRLPDRLETGDLILFRTKSVPASVTRWCTDAPFDHVAMILRTSEGYRTVECTGQGIGCWVLQERIDDYIIKGVVIRRLRARLTNEMVDALNTFLQKVKHKPYRLNQTILQRMVRTCLCCQRSGQNERGLDTTTAAANKRHKKSDKYAATTTTTTGEAGDAGDGDAGDAAPEDVVDDADDTVPIPSLMPPRRREDGSLAPEEEVQLRSPSDDVPVNAAASSSAPPTTATVTTPPPTDVSPPTASTTPSPPASPPRDAKYALELKEHESIRSHYPEPEDIAALHTRSGFFCSSFIAACYMRMGLLPAYPPIDWYLPNTFSARTAIQPPLINAEFGEETLVAKPTKDRRKNKWTRPYEQQRQAQEQMEMQQKQQQQQLDEQQQQQQQQQPAQPAPSSASSPPTSSPLHDLASSPPDAPVQLTRAASVDEELDTLPQPLPQSGFMRLPPMSSRPSTSSDHGSARHLSSSRSVSARQVQASGLGSSASSSRSTSARQMPPSGLQVTAKEATTPTPTTPAAHDDSPLPNTPAADTPPIAHSVLLVTEEAPTTAPTMTRDDLHSLTPSSLPSTTTTTAAAASSSASGLTRQPTTGGKKLPPIRTTMRKNAATASATASATEPPAAAC